jgi:hypothetical protein
MVCEHLSALERELLEHGVKETFRGQAWSENCREWAYFECVLDLATLRARFGFAPCVAEHVHRGTHDGAEAGFVCNQCKDAVMGAHPDVNPGWPIYS